MIARRDALVLKSVLAFLAATDAPGAIRLLTGQNIPLRRADVQNVRFLMQETVQAGFRNSGGELVITADSDPLAAVRGAANRWSSVAGSRLRFAAVEYTNVRPRPRDNLNGIILEDSPEVLSVVGDAIAVTNVQFDPGGVIVEADIYLNPRFVRNGILFPYSTTGAPGTFDFESVILHEMGHGLGANHSAVIGATMFASTTTGATFRAELSSDDDSFAREAYPATGSEGVFGSLSGRLAELPGGAGVRRGLAIAVDPKTGVTIGVQANAEGFYEMSRVPPGEYLLYAEPADGPVFPRDLNQAPADVNTNFRPAFFANNSLPTTVTLRPGLTTNVDLAVETGRGSIEIEFLGVRAPGGQLSLSPHALEVRAGRPTDLFFYGRGIDEFISGDNIRILGPGVTPRPETVTLDTAATANGIVPVRVTVDVVSRETLDLATLAVQRGSDMGVFTGALVIRPSGSAPSVSGAANAASGVTQSFAPDSWVSVFGEGLAPALIVAETTPLPESLGGTRVFVRDSAGVERATVLQFVSPGQVNLLLPAGTALGAARLRVAARDGEGTADIRVDQVAPGVFTANSDGAGAAAAVGLRVRSGGSRESFLTFDFDAASNRYQPAPITLGPEGEQVYISLFATGLRRFQSPVAAEADGASVPVASAGAQGQFEGLDQVNIGPLPRELAGRGVVPVFLVVDGKRSNAVLLNLR
jgi:uncharacterized protein (TIGR03437 family)